MKNTIVIVAAIVALAMTSGCSMYGKGKGKAPEPVVVTNG